MREAIREAVRAWLRLTAGAALSVVCCLLTAVALFTAFLTLTVIGAGVLPESVLLLRRVAGRERRLVAAWTGVPVPEAYLPLEGPLPARVRTALADPGTRRDLIWAAAQIFYGLLLWCASLPLWVVALVTDGVVTGLAGRPALLLPLIPRGATLTASWSRALLTPAPSAARDAALAARVEQLTATRAGAVAAHGAELRRIERDLHDGAQARLVALSVRIGLARRAYDSDPATGRKLLDDAQEQAEEALAELRHVVRGIHPPILTDRGLVGAVRALAASSALDVTVTVEGLAGAGGTAGGDEGATGKGSRRTPAAVETGHGAHPAPAAPDTGHHPPAAPDTGREEYRAPAAVEAAAYFAVAEALTNAAKHSGADRASVLLRREPAGLRVRVRDEGRGGAEAAQATGGTGSAGYTGVPGAGGSTRTAPGGSGLLGMRRRVAALDGTVRLTSPPGGPTLIEVELPCVW
ncbi:histidine kinase [Streptomyces sp.]|uniref:sensor histidine kinase n=1 Tax=Streptomyces sp. TaxID=1931 RepID=UPI0028117F3E|nr:histidine kinase [Streptomyces sp.]